MTTRDRFYWRTIGYHVWGIFERHDDNMPISVRPESDLDKLIESKGARGCGDQAAKEYCRHRTFALNQREGHRVAGISVDNNQDQE